jgi:hypothetical protein
MMVAILERETRVMAVKEARAAAREWVAVNAGRCPGLRAAHLVGGITTMADEAPFPREKDVDMHLIFAEGSPMLVNEGPGFAILEEPYGGIAIEAGLKSEAEYRSAEAVLANPEIAHHLTLDSVLYDPDGLLHGLQKTVRREYPRSRWVLARLEHERRGLAGALELQAFARERWGASGELNILGYTTTFVTAALWVATLSAPQMGGRMFLKLRRLLAAYERLDLHEELLAILGLTKVSAHEVEQFLREATETFDLAIALRRAHPEIAHEFGPFQHKLHAHLRPYLVETCSGMLAEGYHREAMAWVMPYHLATADVVMAYGPETVKPQMAARQAELLRALGLDQAAARAEAIERATELYERIFAFAEEIVASHPEVVD